MNMKPLWLLPALFLLGCSDSDSSKSPPPPAEMVGVWTENVVQAVDSTTDAGNPCSGVTKSGESASVPLFKITSDGKVWDAKGLTITQPAYRLIGQMDARGVIAVNDLGRKEFLEEFADVSFQSATIHPVVKAVFEFDALKGGKLNVTIDMQFVTQGQSITQPFRTREYFAASETLEKNLLTKAQLCLEKTKN